MGMYDEFRFLAPLPGGEPARPFQTKDFDCTLDMFIVREDGRLWVHRHGWIRDATTEPERHCFDGSVDFYDFDPTLDPDWVEYRAEFRDGVVRSVVRLTPPESEAK